MKILQVTETLHEGGAELFLLRLTRELRKKGVDASVLILDKKQANQRLLSHFQDIPIVSLQLPMYRIIHLIDRFFFKLRTDVSLKKYYFRKKLRERIGNATIVHSHHIVTDHLLSQLKQKYFFKHLVTVHGDYSAQYYHHKQYGSSVWRSIDDKLDLLKRSVNAWVLISEEQIHFFQNVMQIDRSSILKIWNGYSRTSISINSPILPYLKKDTFLIGMAGRGVKEKGWELAIEAVRRMPKNCHLILIGDSPYLQELKKKSVSVTNVTFLGFVEEPVKVIEKCDVLLLPTLFPYESLPNVIIESLSVGVPVIATRVGDIEKMITDNYSDGKAGSLLEMVDGKIDVKHISEKIMELYYERDKLENMKKVARIVSLKFSMENCVNSYLQAYKNLL